MATPTPAPTDTPVPTDTPTVSPTHTPTETPAPTDTPIPTDTPTPTNTPLPTNTPTVTPTPTPISGMSVARTAHIAALLPDGKVLFAGGTGSDGNKLGSAELYEPETGSWTSSGSLNIPRSILPSIMILPRIPG